LGGGEYVDERWGCDGNYGEDGWTVVEKIIQSDRMKIISGCAKKFLKKFENNFVKKNSGLTDSQKNSQNILENNFLKESLEYF